jgi:hypothetical protein
MKRLFEQRKRNFREMQQQQERAIGEILLNAARADSNEGLL